MALSLVDQTQANTRSSLKVTKNTSGQKTKQKQNKKTGMLSKVSLFGGGGRGEGGFLPVDMAVAFFCGALHHP